MISTAVVAVLAITQVSLTPNQSFEDGLAGWRGFGAQLERVEVTDAPQGRSVVRVAADDTRDSYALDDAVDPVADARAGWTYTATAQVRATSATEGREVGVVVRETDRSGGGLRQVGDAETRVRSSADGYREVSVSYTAREDGSAIDVYLRRPPGTLVDDDAFLADDLRLVLATPAERTKSNPTFALHRIAIDAAPDFSAPARTATGHRFVVVQRWRTDILRDLKEAARRQGDDVRVLMYQNATFMQDPEEATGRHSSCVSTEQAADHPEWFLRERDGSKMSSEGFGFLFGADVGEIDYRERCRDNILAALEAEPLWDGVLLDDVNSTLSGHRSRVDGGRHEPVYERLADGSLAQLPYEDYLRGSDRPDPATDEEWELRVGGLLETVGGAVRERERLAIANFCCEERNEAWDGYLDHLSGGLSEFFVKYPPPGFGVQSLDDRSSYRGASDGWAQQLSLADEAERRNKWFLGGMVARPDDERAARWGVANLMLVSRGRSSLQLVGKLPGDSTPSGDETGYYTRESRPPIFDLARRLGDPIAPRFEVIRAGEPTGVWRRDFRDGVVLVNPRDDGGVQRIELESDHSGSGLSAVSSVEVGELEGLVLKRDG